MQHQARGLEAFRHIFGPRPDLAAPAVARCGGGWLPGALARWLLAGWLAGCGVRWGCSAIAPQLPTNLWVATHPLQGV